MVTRITVAIREAAPDLTVEAANRIGQAVLSCLSEEIVGSASALAEAVSEPVTRRSGESDVDWNLRAAVLMGAREGEDEAAYGRRLDALRAAQQDARKDGYAAQDAMDKATAVWSR